LHVSGAWRTADDQRRRRVGCPCCARRDRRSVHDCRVALKQLLWHRALNQGRRHRSAVFRSFHGRHRQTPEQGAQTLHVGEKGLDPRAYNTGGWYYDEPIACGGGGGTAMVNSTKLVRDAIGFPYANWGAAHTSGVPFAFVDGHVEVLIFSIDSTILTALLSPSQGDVVPSY
jgi:prepilin-type processing-associated H-X9-DG protein